MTQLQDFASGHISEVKDRNFSGENSDLLALEKQLPQKFAAGEIDMLMSILGCTADQQINCVLHFNAHLDKKRLERAVTLTYYTEPVLGSRFVITPDKVYWERRKDLQELELLQYLEPENLDEAISNFVTAHIDPSVDLPVQISLIRGEKQDTLCVKVRHEAIDGRGIKEYVRLLSHFYQQLKENPQFLPKPKTSVDRSLKQIFKRLGFFRRLWVWLQLRIRTPNMSFPWKSTEAKTRRVSIRKIAADKFTEMKAYSKKLKVSVTDMLMTAFYRALFRLKQVPEKVKFIGTVTVDLRRYLPGCKATSLCNLTTSSHVKAKYVPGETFEETLEQIHKSSKDFKRKGAGLESALFCKLLLGMKFAKAKVILEDSVKKELEIGATFPIVTNIGLVREEELSFGELKINDGFIVAPYTKAPGFLMGVATLDKTMVLSLGYFEESYDTSVINQFLDYMVDELTFEPGVN